MEQTSRRKKWLVPLIILLMGAMVISAMNLWLIYRDKVKTQSLYGDLLETVEQADPAAPYRSLYESNQDFVGWLWVDGTNISYPVMQNKVEREFYLKHDFNKENDKHGTPFLDAKCDLSESDNLIIYGHNMRDDTMFAQLSKFTDKAFCEKNPCIHLATMDGADTWQVVCVFKISAKDTRQFPYHTVTKFSRHVYSPQDYLDKAKPYALWSRGEALSPDAKLITLSTCEYTLQNGRLVVIAEKIK